MGPGLSLTCGSRRSRAAHWRESEGPPRLRGAGHSPSDTPYCLRVSRLPARCARPTAAASSPGRRRPRSPSPVRPYLGPDLPTPGPTAAGLDGAREPGAIRPRRASISRGAGDGQPRHSGSGCGVSSWSEGRTMASNGICDRVAIVGMGCTSFGERWDKGANDLLVDATKDALASACIEMSQIDAFWLGTLFSGNSGLTLSRPLKIGYKPVTRVENFCATGSEAFRNACYAVASGAYDVAMAIGVEKLKDSGVSGLPGTRSVGDGTGVPLTAPAMFSLLAPSYAKKYGVTDEQLKEVMTRIAWKNHKNGALNPRAQFRKEVPKETIACSPLVAGPLGIFDCSGVSDGSAAAVIVRAEDAHRYTDRPLWEGALVRGRPRRRPHGSGLRLHELPRGGGLGGRRLRPGRHQGP